MASDRYDSGLAARWKDDEKRHLCGVVTDSHSRTLAQMSPACPVYGFLIHVRSRPGVEAGEFSRRLSEFLATRGLVASGNMPTLVVCGESTQATDGDREVVREWLAERSEIAHADVGPLSDVGGLS